MRTVVVDKTCFAGASFFPSTAVLLQRVTVWELAVRPSLHHCQKSWVVRAPKARQKADVHVPCPSVPVQTSTGVYKGKVKGKFTENSKGKECVQKQRSACRSNRHAARNTSNASGVAKGKGKTKLAHDGKSKQQSLADSNVS